MPEPQLICTVKATMSSPMPSLSAATRAGFISSAITLTQPRMTWSKVSGENGWRASSGRPHCTARSTGVNGPGPERALRNGVRLPSTMKTGRAISSPPSAHQFPERTGARRRVFCNRRQRFRREIVDLDHLCDGFTGGRELFAFGLRDDALLHRFLPVMQARGVHLLGN